MSKLTVEKVMELRKEAEDGDLSDEDRATALSLCDMAIASVRDAEPVAFLTIDDSDQDVEFKSQGRIDALPDGRYPLFLATAQPSADELKGWAVFGPDGDCDHVVAGESEQFAWESFSQNSNWRTKNVPPEHWKEKGYTCVEVRITRLARSAT